MIAESIFVGGEVRAKGHSIFGGCCGIEREGSVATDRRFGAERGFR